MAQSKFNESSELPWKLCLLCVQPRSCNIWASCFQEQSTVFARSWESLAAVYPCNQWRSHLGLGLQSFNWEQRRTWRYLWFHCPCRFWWGPLVSPLVCLLPLGIRDTPHLGLSGWSCLCYQRTPHNHLQRPSLDFLGCARCLDWDFFPL